MGLLTNLFWLSAPKALKTSIYIFLGWLVRILNLFRQPVVILIATLMRHCCRQTIDMTDILML